MNYNHLIEIAAFSPKSLQFPNAWVGHLPFAAWVIKDVCPRIFVELGTHSGNSYFSFCQGVVEAGTSTQCYAVDTWQGDEQAGQYSDEIFAKVNEHNQEQYAGFSQLLRMTFDEAAPYFKDDSIELLHIDGLHTYEAVRHDFETWLPKLAPGAVVMFHDTNVRDHDFGVWKLWEELRLLHPNNLEFRHSHGLGVLQLNNAPDNKKLEWLQSNSPEKRKLLDYFAALGSRQLERFDLKELKQHVAHLDQIVIDRDNQITHLRQVVGAHELELADLKQHAANLSQVVVAREFEIADLKQHAANLSKIVDECESEIAILQKSLAERKEQIDNFQRIAERAEFFEGQLKDAEKKIAEILTSKSWRLTEPIRAFRRRIQATKHEQSERDVVHLLDSQINNLNQAISVQNQQIDHLNHVSGTRDSEIALLQKTLAEKEEQLDNFRRIAERAEFLEGQLKDVEKEIAEILASKSWRLTEPLRVFRRRLQRKQHKQSESTVDKHSVMLRQGSTAVASEEQPTTPVAVDPDFDAEFYHQAYPDTHGLDPFFHYSRYGKNEGRLPRAPVLDRLDDQIKPLDQSKATVLIVSHEASRTGAPILSLNIAQQLKGKYNIVLCFLRGGDMLAEFQEHFDIVIHLPQLHNNFVFSKILDRLENETEIKFAIVNSIVSSSVLPSLAYHFIPSLCLIHEFASYTRPPNLIPEAILWASDIVFSAGIVYKNAADHYEALKKREAIILPQGKCVVPSSQCNEQADKKEKQRIRKLFRPDSLPDNAVVILGAGFVHLRKGVDIFLACAARVLTLCPKNTFRFVWAGNGFDPESDANYSAFLQDQISRSGLESVVCFTGEIFDIELAYELSDVLFLSSRLDPLPNVAIDAMLQQLPVICFEQTTGIADLLKENGLGEACVIPYLDIEQAAQRLVTLIEDAEQRIRLGTDIKEVGKKLFDLKRYVDSLERHALDCGARQEIEKRDCTLIEEDGTLDLDFFSPPAWVNLSRREAVRAFVRTWSSGIDLRKPFPGFHPGIFEDRHGLSRTQRNPLAAFIEAGKPDGPWLCELIEPIPDTQLKNEDPLRTALHIHVFFVDLFSEILKRFEGQGLHLDLLISVPSLEVAEEVAAMTKDYAGGQVDLRVVPNRGRDIGPFLTEFGETILNNYDVIGHVHTKKSGDVKDPATGQIWYRFLLENLIGGKFPMASLIVERMAVQEKIGIVFPDEPNVVGWSSNKEIAESLAHQLDIKELPARHFNFPVGNMFWARTEALKPLLSKNLRWEDYPEEPLSYDGTMLHAIERLLPFVAQKMDYRVAMTHVPGVTR